MSVPRWWTPTVRHAYADGPRSYCGLCGRRYGNAIHRAERVPKLPVIRPRCAECGREGYRTEIGKHVMTVVGHLDQRIKHAFRELS